jgi:hypothetical protein
LTLHESAFCPAASFLARFLLAIFERIKSRIPIIDQRHFDLSIRRSGPQHELVLIIGHIRSRFRFIARCSCSDVNINGRGTDTAHISSQFSQEGTNLLGFGGKLHETEGRAPQGCRAVGLK